MRTYFWKFRREFGTFDAYIWQFTGGKTIVNHWDGLKQIPATSPESDAMAKDMKKEGVYFLRKHHLLCFYAGALGWWMITGGVFQKEIEREKGALEFEMVNQSL